MSESTTIADRMRNARKAASLSQRELASLAGVGVSTITDIEYRLDDGDGWGSAVSFGETTTGTYATTAEPGDLVQIRLVTGAGSGDWSNTEIVPVVFADDFSGRAENVLLGADAAWTFLRNPNGSDGDAVTLNSSSQNIRRESGNGTGIPFYTLNASGDLPANQRAQITIGALTSTLESAASAL
jgi:hypothetical protein